jgi:hypothetical protein
MRIEPSGLTPLGPGSAEKSASTGASGAPVGSRTSGGENVSLPTDSGYLPSVELAHLTRLARAEPEVRLQRVREVAEKYAQGHYSTPQAAAKTAAAILTGAD